MADTLSVLVLNPLHMITQRTVIEITVAGALIMKPSAVMQTATFCQIHCAAGRYIQMLQRDRLDWSAVTTGRLVLLH